MFHIINTTVNNIVNPTTILLIASFLLVSKSKYYNSIKHKQNIKHTKSPSIATCIYTSNVSK